MTLRVIGAIIGGAVSFLALLLWSTQKMYPGFGLWTLGKMVASGATFATLGWAQPAWFTSIVGGILAIASVTLGLSACREFLGFPPTNRPINAVLGLLLVLGALLLQFGSADGLIALTLVGGGVMYGWTALTLLRAPSEGSRTGRLATGAIYLVLCPAYIAFGLGRGLRPEITVFAATFSIASIVATILGNFGFFLMHYERLLFQREQELDQTARTNRELAHLKAHLEDAVEQKTAELVQAQKMEVIGRLAGGVAHDFNNLLTVINGHSRLLLSKIKPGDPSRKGIEEINKAGEHATRLTRQLLAFSRKQVLQSRVVELDLVLADMQSMLEPLAGEQVAVAFHLNAPSGMVLTDPHQLEQVVMNLAVNARDAMPSGGLLSIETALAGTALHPASRPGPWVRITITDTGIGMHQETQSHMFDPFFTTKDVGMGTGLGLAMVHGIVTQSGGYIEVDSKPGQGTAFHIFLPQVDGPPARQTPAVALPASIGTETVLVVEDQPEVGNYVVNALEAYGYRALPVQSPGDALLRFERDSENIDLVLTDIVMPNLTGRELACRLQKLRPDLKVLFMSGYADVSAGNPAQQGAGVNFIQKPFSPEELAAKVRQVLGSTQPASKGV
jgi:signal transduction histidine kinase/ActR/RegA family two-component response regulator